tara:strand:- start:315 stop:596 length:282 start_codon:yes stop_codon:yes gene_type:complete
MQSFTGAGFSNEEIKKEDIVKQIKSKADAINAIGDLGGEIISYGSSRGLLGYFMRDKSSSEYKQYNTKQEKEYQEILKLLMQIKNYLEAMPHD